MTTTDHAMPELPEPTYIYHTSDEEGGDDLFEFAHSGAVDIDEHYEGGVCSDCVRLYTANQMREYARAAIQQAAGAVPDLLQSCRGSVKADLMRYEQMILSRPSPEYVAAYEQECNRLQALLDSIDALDASPSSPVQPDSGHLVAKVSVFQYARCTNTLRTLGRPYPRTCAECGLGPCKTGSIGQINPGSATREDGHG